MKPLRIVLVMVEPPLPFGNAAARWFYVLLKGLVERGHRVSAFATCSKPDEIRQAKALFPAHAYDLRCYAHPVRAGLAAKLETLRRPYSYMFSPKLRADLERNLTSGYDILHLEQLWTGWLGLAHVDRAVINVHYLSELDQRGFAVASAVDLARRRISGHATRRLLRSYPTICTLTSRLSTEVRRISPASRVHTTALAIDLSTYPFRQQERNEGSPIVGLIGSFGWHPTYSAGERLLTRLWPRIKARIGNAKLLIAGRSARTALKCFLDLSDVSIYQNVPDIIPYFRRIGVLLYAPPQGSGMKIKVLEAMALGTPVVTTSHGVEGLPAKDGVEAGICEDDSGLVDRTIALLNDSERREAQRSSARALVESYCSPPAALDRFEAVYKQVILRPRASAAASSS